MHNEKVNEYFFFKSLRDDLVSFRKEQKYHNQTVNEDFSFKSLRDNLVSLRKEQKYHFLRSASKTYYATDKQICHK